MASPSASSELKRQVASEKRSFEFDSAPSPASVLADPSRSGTAAASSRTGEKVLPTALVQIGCELI